MILIFNSIQLNVILFESVIANMRLCNIWRICVTNILQSVYWTSSSNAESGSCGAGVGCSGGGGRNGSSSRNSSSKSELFTVAGN